ncbi:MAG: hypothetical protein ACKVWV_03330 [Planctomycetota bacterium]
MKCLPHALLALAAVLPTVPAHAQCLTWSRGFGANGTNGTVLSMLVFDDGTGPALYAGGEFTRAAGVQVNYVARFDGSSWTPLADGVGGPVAALSIYDDGSGPALFAAGNFLTAGGVPARSIAKWDGSAWSSLGAGLDTSAAALAVFDDGSGPALFVGGYFTLAGGSPARKIAKWDGATWSALGAGISSTAQQNMARVLALAVHDDGSGAQLYASGDFTKADGLPAIGVARWNGAAWSAVGAGLPNSFGESSVVRALAVHDAGSGTRLFAGAPSGVFAWNGATWTGTPAPSAIPVHALAVHDDGTGAKLYAGGGITTNGGVARFNGASWSAVATTLNGSVRALARFDDGSGGGAHLYAGGTFNQTASLVTNFVARLSGAAWTTESNGQGFGDDVRALTVFDDNLGGGPRLYAAGSFTFAGSLRVSSIARLGVGTWETLSSGMDGEVLSMLGIGSGQPGATLVVGGRFRRAGTNPAVNKIARRVGTAWSGFGTGMLGKFATVESLAWHDDGSGPQLYAGGEFAVAGGTVASHIAKWNGTQWIALGRGVGAESGVEFGNVRALISFDDGSGPALFVGGRFVNAGIIAAANVATWRGATIGWLPVGGGVTGSFSPEVRAFAVFDDGGGAKLYAGGRFETAEGNPAGNVARWDGTQWTPLSSGTDGPVNALAVWDDGSGAKLYAAGAFATAGGVPARNIARFDGVAWSALETGLDDAAHALATFDDGGTGGADLYGGGAFLRAGTHSSARVGKFHDCGP